jgi:hypothetical protein
MNSRIWFAAAAVAVIIAIFLLALGVDSLEFGSGFRVSGGESGSASGGAPAMDREAAAGYRLVVRILVFAAAAVIVVSLFVKPLRRQLMKSAVVIALALVVLSLINPTYPDQEEEPEDEGRPGLELGFGDAGSGPVVDPDEVITNEVSPLITFTVSVLLIGLGGLVIVALLRVRRSRRGRGDLGDLIADEAERTVRTLETKGVSYPDAITECYATMEKVVRDALSLSRRPAMTPREFVSTVVAAGAPRDELMTLTELFEEVKYGDRPPDPSRAARARDALRSIASACRSRERVAS